MTFSETAGTVLAHGAGGGADEFFLLAGLGSCVFGVMKLTDKSKPRGRRLLGIPLILLGLALAAAPFVFRFGQ